MVLRVLLLSLLCSPALAAERSALVIGNASYEVGALRNPVNDANDVADSLRSIGFDVVLATNVSREGMLHNLAEFRKKLQPGGLAVVYYSGHGVEVDGQNWLLPVKNANIQTQTDVRIYSVSTQDLLREMEESGAKLNLLILDACRDNPLPAVQKSASRGLARIDTGSSTRSSTLVAYATAPGKTAADGNGRNSPYTALLKEALKTPGLSVTDLVNQVGALVKSSTDGAQIPWNSGTPIWPPIYLAGGPPADGEITPPAVNIVAPIKQELSTTGSLDLQLHPPETTVHINGTSHGSGSSIINGLTPGKVTIKLDAPGYRSRTIPQNIIAGEVGYVKVALLKEYGANAGFSPSAVVYYCCDRDGVKACQAEAGLTVGRICRCGGIAGYGRVCP